METGGSGIGDWLAQALMADKQATWAALTETAEFTAGLQVTLIVSAIVTTLLVVIAYSVGRRIGFSSYKTAIAAAVRSFGVETVRRERTYQKLLHMKEGEAGAKLRALNEELEEANRVERMYRVMAAKYQRYLRRRRWGLFPPRATDLRFADVLTERDELVEMNFRLAEGLREVLVRVDGLPADLRDALKGCVADAAADDEPASRPRQAARLIGG